MRSRNTPQPARIRPQTPKDPRASQHLRSKPLISLNIFLLKFSSNCHEAAWMLAFDGSQTTSSQSYPQVLWAVSDSCPRRFATNL
jgi:hypothetical protein